MFNLKRPCAHCPFRNDRPTFLRASRAQEIATEVGENDKTFYCHETVEYGRDGLDGEGQCTQKSQQCAGQMIVLEKMDRPNQMMRIGERIGAYDRTRLHMSSPTYDSMQDFADAHAHNADKRVA
jgi:hypothetical protein